MQSPPPPAAAQRSSILDTASVAPSSSITRPAASSHASREVTCAQPWLLNGQVPPSVASLPAPPHQPTLVAASWAASSNSYPRKRWSLEVAPAREVLLGSHLWSQPHVASSAPMLSRSVSGPSAHVPPRHGQHSVRCRS